MSEPYTSTDVADIVTSVDGDFNDNHGAWVGAVVRNPGAEVVCVDMTLFSDRTREQTKFKITIERTSAP